MKKSILKYIVISNEHNKRRHEIRSVVPNHPKSTETMVDGKVTAITMQQHTLL